MRRTGRRAPVGRWFTSRRVKTPTVFQMEATECGAAALAIVLGYYGRFIPLESLRIECGISRDGSQAINVLKAARLHGMIAKGAKVEEIDVFRKMELPCIVFWEFDHFVVVEGTKGSRFYINDPATGPRSVSREEFDRSFTGIVLIIEPGPTFQRQGTQPSLVGPLADRLEGSATPLLFVLLATLALTIPGILVAGLSKVFIDSILIQDVGSWAIWVILGLLLTALLRGLLTWLQETAVMRLKTKMSLTHTATFFWHILHLPISFFQQRFAGDIGERIDANERIALLLANEFSAGIVAMFAGISYAAVMLLLNWQIGMLAIVLASVNASIFYLSARAIADKSRVLLQQQGLLSGIEANALQSIESIKAMAGESGFFARWAGLHAKTINSQQQIELYSSSLEIVSQLLNGLATVILFGYGGFLIMQGELSVGTLVALQSLLMSFLAPITTLLSLGTETQQIRGDLMRLSDGLSYPPDPVFTRESGRDELRARGSVGLQGVTFGYTPLAPPVVEDISFSLSSGNRIALIGATGSGKSTLARLICRFYSPGSGQILIAGKPIQKMDPEEMSQVLAFVDQDILLFEGTVADNLTLWNPEIPAAQVQRAMADACIDDVIAARGGLLSHVDEDGSNFSGGERQRLEIARALTADPSVLILDEATASLDPLVEFEIYQNIIRRNCAALIIAHRLSAIRDCDEILVMEGGHIIARGTHDQLLNASRTYQRFYSLESQHDSRE
jgi:NHLM bacteriocin system ABC transporter peptidase/ATP-binding protein